MSRLAVFFLLVAAPALSFCLAWLGLETLRENVLGWVLLVLGIAYPVGGAIYFFVRRKPFWRSSRPGGVLSEETGDRSFWLILPGFLVVFFASPLEWIFLPALIPRVPWLQAAGMGLIISAVALRIWARTYIRGEYSGHVEVLAGHRLVQSGPYQFVRHPGYTGFLLMALGIAISYSSLAGLISIPLLLLPGLTYRMRVEERLLTDQFGDEYRAYAEKTRRLIPLVW